MADLSSVSTLETLISEIAGKSESAAVKADIAIAGTAVSLLAQTLVPRLDPALDLAFVDAALTKVFAGLADLKAALASTAAPSAAPAETDPATPAPTA
ncbi:hypothetical protein [Gluconacetobacter diazotrophicus]|uniref:Uncharacterized protein n=1 Tax=Gluconacetobacter diazotrophicus (strain ATCC 49037 / DSM 5601 / CCUG 37298 / CIP 103539 / LMG 7603 / PAl5) TaxID=272568 RepID=A9H6I3_GLUDA|nr:hypothetical protein [Gluconacetobacter diazotrophicus]CAP57500.1 hypothetical protein GDI3557 [Gluconacetobacter diazotrophicus PA1 5]